MKKEEPPLRTRRIPSPPIRDIVTHIAAPMPVALPKRLRHLGDLGPADDAIRNRKPIVGPARRLETADRV